MYREPHLNEKSAECAVLWHQWFDVNYNQKDKEKAKELRKEWCECASELGRLVSEEVKTNSRYKGIELFPGKGEPPR